MGVQSDGDRCRPDVDNGLVERHRGKVSALAVGEVQRAGVEDAGPHVCTHNTDAGLDQEDNSPFQDAAQAGSPSLFGKGGGKYLGVFPHFSLPNRRMKMGSIPMAFLCHLLFLSSQPARPQGHLQRQA